jgi:hypothetical protein
MVVDVLVRPLRWVARAATGLAFAAAVILGAGLAAQAPAAATAPAVTATVSASASESTDVADRSLAAAAPAQDTVDAPVTRPVDRVAVDRWQRPAPGQRGPPSGE